MNDNTKTSLKNERYTYITHKDTTKGIQANIQTYITREHN